MQQWKIMQTISPHDKCQTLRDFGFNLTEGIFKNANRKYKQNGGIIINPQTQKTGRPEVPEEVKEDVYNFAMDDSDYMGDRLLKRISQIVGKDMFARSLRNAKSRLWRTYEKRKRFKIEKSKFFVLLRSYKLFKKKRKGQMFAGLVKMQNRLKSK